MCFQNPCFDATIDRRPVEPCAAAWVDPLTKATAVCGGLSFPNPAARCELPGWRECLRVGRWPAWRLRVGRWLLGRCCEGRQVGSRKRRSRGRCADNVRVSGGGSSWTAVAAAAHRAVRNPTCELMHPGGCAATSLCSAAVRLTCRPWSAWRIPARRPAPPQSRGPSASPSSAYTAGCGTDQM